MGESLDANSRFGGGLSDRGQLGWGGQIRSHGLDANSRAVGRRGVLGWGLGGQIGSRGLDANSCAVGRGVR